MTLLDRLRREARRRLAAGVRDAYVWSCEKFLIYTPAGVRRVWDYHPVPSRQKKFAKYCGIYFLVILPFTDVLPRFGLLPRPPGLLVISGIFAMNTWMFTMLLGPKRIPGSVRFEGDPRPGDDDAGAPPGV